MARVQITQVFLEQALAQADGLLVEEAVPDIQHRELDRLVEATVLMALQLQMQPQIPVLAEEALLVVIVEEREARVLLV